MEVPIGLITTELKLRSLSPSIPLKVARGKGWELAGGRLGPLAETAEASYHTRTCWGFHQSP